MVRGEQLCQGGVGLEKGDVAQLEAACPHFATLFSRRSPRDSQAHRHTGEAACAFVWRAGQWADALHTGFVQVGRP